MKVSIVIPVLNQIDVFRQCLTSISKTAPENTDVIVVDSASTEPIREEFEKFAGSSPRISSLYARLEKNAGVTIPWNIGLDLALEHGADVVCISNSDVIYGPKVIERCAEMAEKIGACFPLSIQGGPKPYDFDGRAKMHADLEPVNSSMVNTGGFAGWCFFLSRKTIEKVGRFDEQFVLWFQDTDYFWRLKSAGITPLEVRCCLLHHFQSKTILSMPKQFDCYGWRENDERKFKAKYKQG